ncbi:MAG TPA: tetratricopeptide repeat protein [Cyclobacteriaceae bacterium]|jgi:tetratricopeptide (TPR) repeat protein|nr:tetratricopeptide repeat protein [Cyclobacteriaceae bacterium]
MRTATNTLLILLIVLFNVPCRAQGSKLDSLKNVLIKLPADSNRVLTLVSICHEQQKIHPDSVLNTAQKALRLSQEIKYKIGEAYAYNQLAFAYHRQGKILKAADCLLKASEIYKALHLNDVLESLYNNIAILYFTAGEESKSIIFLNRAIEINRVSGDSTDLIIGLTNLGDAYLKAGSDSLALIYQLEALAISNILNERELKPNILRGIGEIYYKQKHYQQALATEQQALQLAYTNDSAQAYEIQISLAKIYTALGLHKKAMKAAEIAISLARKADDRVVLKEGYLLLSQTYADLGDYEEAYKSYTKYFVLYDSIGNVDNAIAVEKLNYQHEIEKKESQIANLYQKHNADTFKRNAFIVALITLLVIALLLYNRHRLIATRNMALKKQELDFYVKSLLEKSEALASINEELDLIKIHRSDDSEQTDKYKEIYQCRILTEEDWDNFKKSFEGIYPTFFPSLRLQYPQLTTAELRLSALIKLNLTIKEISTILGISPDSVKTARYRLKKKYQLEENETLRDFINKITSKIHRDEANVKG